MSRYLDPKAIDEKTKVVSQDLLDVPEIAQAIELSEESAYTIGELDVYQSYWDSVSREKTFMVDSFEKGFAVGEAKGAVKEKREIAKKMLKRGFSIAMIAEDTGLTQKEIAELVKSL